jgi:hypothetical protein
MISKPETDQDTFSAGNAEKRTIDHAGIIKSGFMLGYVGEKALT